jgi:hypothetical protein
MPLRVREVRASADDIEALVRRLRDGEAIDAQGVAMIRRLLNDGASPLFYRRSSVTLATLCARPV